MSKHSLRGAGFFLLLLAVFAQAMLMPRPAYAQYAQTDPSAAQQFQQLVAPIALYPDPLLGEVLMASAYPLEVVMAARWRDANPGISGDYLTDALMQQHWDPSVKALTAFPQVLRMMNDNLDWTEKLGEAFLADQQGVLTAVQQLRQQAQASGALYSNQQQAVSLQSNGAITIEPASPQSVYVPYYDPAAVFSPWPYPAYMPYSFAAPPGVVYTGAGFFSYFPAIIIVSAFQDFDHFDWREHRIDLDDRRWSELNNNRPPVNDGQWSFDRDHRHGVPFKNPAVRANLESTPPAVQRSFRGFENDRNAPAAGVNQRQVTGSRFVTAQRKEEAAASVPPQQMPEVRRGMMPPEQMRSPETKSA